MEKEQCVLLCLEMEALRQDTEQMQMAGRWKARARETRKLLCFRRKKNGAFCLLILSPAYLYELSDTQIFL